MTLKIMPSDALSVEQWLQLVWVRKYDLSTSTDVSQQRHAMLALAGRRVVGHWFIESLDRRGGKTVVGSGATFVVSRYRRQRVAQRLWLRGVSYWGADIVYASAGSEAGAEFLARAAIWLAHRGIRTEFDYGEFDAHDVDARARRLLRRARARRRVRLRDPRR